MNNKSLVQQNFETMMNILKEMSENQNRDPRKGKSTPSHGHSSEKTRRGATHIVNPTFRSRSLWDMSPAEYRRNHMGAKPVIPNYKKIHAVPRARNVVVTDVV